MTSLSCFDFHFPPAPSLNMATFKMSLIAEIGSACCLQGMLSALTLGQLASFNL